MERLKAQVRSPQDTIWLLETKDGNHYTGRVRQSHQDTLEITTDIGILRMPKSQIKTISPIVESQLVHGEYWPENPHANRYFWGPSGYGLRKGEGYYQNIWVLLNQVSYGFSDNFSMGIGVLPSFLLGGDLSDTPFWLTPKIAVPYKNGKGAFSFGTLLFSFLGSTEGFIGILYGANTFGTREKQVTIGMGYGYSSEDGLASRPTFSLSGMWRTGKKWALVTENYLINTGGSTHYGFVSGGARYITSRLAVDFAGFVPLGPDISGSYVLPWLGITFPFKY